MLSSILKNESLSTMTGNFSIKASIDNFLDAIQLKLRPRSVKAYTYSLHRFSEMLINLKINVDDANISELNTEWIYKFATTLNDLAPSTQQLYLTVIIQWCKYLLEKKLIDLDILKVRENLRKRVKHRTIEIEPPPKDFEISKIIAYVNNVDNYQPHDVREKLKWLRDRAFVLVLAETGLSSEAIRNLRRGDIDWHSGKITLRIGSSSHKTVNISPRTLIVLEEFFTARRELSKIRILNSSYVFIRFDQAALEKSLPISSQTSRNIISQRADEALGSRYDGVITPKSFRHYFASSFLQSIDLLHPKIIQRCKQLFENGHYDEAIFNGMKTVEEEVRKKISASNTDLGVPLITKAMNPNNPIIMFSDVGAEQEAAYYLFRGSIGSFKNPLSHRFLDTSDPKEAFECLTLSSLLLRMLDSVS